jgi:hypothetical protein
MGGLEEWFSTVAEVVDIDTMPVQHREVKVAERSGSIAETQVLTWRHFPGRAASQQDWQIIRVMPVAIGQAATHCLPGWL